MRTLAQATWLNDEVISMWLGLLNVRTLAAGNVKRVHFFETHFFAASFATLRRASFVRRARVRGAAALSFVW